MKTKNRVLAAILCLMLVAQCGLSLVSCGSEKCDHSYGEWTVVSAGSCTEEAVKQRTCSHCHEVETSRTEATGHDWAAATCAAPKTCKTCKATEGEALSHTWADATCTAPKTCTVCQATEGAALSHTWADATCTAPKTCTVCQATEGAALSHTWADATCTTPKTCTVCQATEGAALSHTWADATCTTPKTCTVCQATEGAALNHDWADATCTAPKTCKRCQATEGAALNHDWADATCTTPKTCTVCQATEGAALNHDWADATCTAPKTCKRCQATEGAALNHDWVEATCDTAKTCSRCQAKEGDPLGHKYQYTSNGDGTHTRTCLNDPEESLVEDCSGGEATCTDKAHCDLCHGVYGDEPSHDWDEGEITKEETCLVNGEKTYTCSTCHQTRVETITAEGHDYASVVTEPTCEGEGYTTHTCSQCNDSYVTDHTDPTGHDWKEEPTCAHDRECKSCDATQDALGHNYEMTDETEATCQSPLKRFYTCSGCGDTYDEEIGVALKHDFRGVSPVELPQEGTTCEFVQYYKCNVCENDIPLETIERHTYSATVLKGDDATCSADGKKTLTCQTEGCGHVTTEKIAKTSAGHNWVATEVAGTQKCSHCGEEKSVTVVSGNKTDKMETEALKNSELQLDNASIALGKDVVDSIGQKDVVVSADKLEGDDRGAANLTPDQLKQVGDNPVYNFTIYDVDAGKNISKFGEENFVTITIPYTLGEDEDVDSVAIWFIGENGELESIPAIYNNGTVTFKTNHFSYYTITRLNPEDRCLVYGCQERTTVVEGDCTTDGYYITICLRCHKTTGKVITSVATGHVYEEVVTDATCTKDGKITHRCTNEGCSYSYSEKIPATGHLWEVKEEVAASCAAVGHTLYQCATCENTYRVITPKLSHSMTEKVYAPGCEEMGYTQYACRNCDYGYQSNFVPALGHDWADATCTEPPTCKGCGATVGKAEGHAWKSATCEDPKTCSKCGATEGDALGHKWVEATCTSPKNCSVCHVEEGKALGHDWNEASCTEAKTCKTCGATEGGAPGHDWAEATCETAKTCKTCGETEGAALGHKWNAATCETAKTCSVCSATEGEALGHKWADADCDTPLTCTVCGLTDKDALGHKWKDATCETPKTCEACGATEGSALGHKWADADCETPKTCETCAKTEGSALGHEWADATCETPKTCQTCGKTEGEQLGHDFQNGECTRCEEKENNCDHQELSYKVIKLADHGACGGAIVYRTCACGEVVYCDDFDSFFDASFCEEEILFENEEIDRETGTYMEEMKIQCPDCGLTVYYKYVGVETNCKESSSIEWSFSIGDEEIFAATLTDEDVYHSDEKMEVIDLHEKYGCCEGAELSTAVCVDCGEIVFLSAMPKGCGGVALETKTEGDKTYIDFACEECGLSVYVEMIERKNQCGEDVYNYLKIQVKDEIILEMEKTYGNSNHDYEETYEFVGNGCTEGYWVTYTCKTCGDTEKYMSVGHTYYTSTMINLKDLGIACGGSAWGSYCEICHELGNLHNVEYGCSFDEEKIEYVEEFLNEEKTIVRTYMKGVCVHCGTVWEWEEIEETINACEYERETSLLAYDKDGKRILKESNGEHSSSHQWEETYEIEEGATCDDGYVVHKYCPECGTTREEKSWGHNSSWEEIHLGCESYIEVYVCRICGEQTSYWWNTGCRVDNVTNTTEVIDGVTHSILTLFCEECGFTYISDRWMTPGDRACNWNYYTRLTVTDKSGKQVFDGTDVDRYTEHTWEYTYEKNGETCEDGGVSIRGVCTVCGATISGESYGHYTKTEQTDLKELGIPCGGTLDKEICQACGETVNVWFKYNCRFSSDEEEGKEDGNDTAVCSVCGVTRKTARSEKQIGCTVEVTYTNTFYAKDGTELLALESVERYSRHEIVETFEKHGETCEDGYTVIETCKNCDYTDSWEESDHRTECVEVDLSEKGVACGGYVEYEICTICDAVTYSNENTWCNWMPVEGEDEKEAGHYRCERCGAERYESYETVIEGCTTKYISTVTLCVNGNEVATVVRTDSYDRHQYDYTFNVFGESCKDGYEVRGVCKKCGDTMWEKRDWHTLYEVETIELSENGACGGVIRIEKCPCGEHTQIGFDAACDFEYLESDKGEMDEKTESYVKRCRKCGLTVTEKTEYVQNGCMMETVRTMIFERDGVEIYSVSYVSNSYENHPYETTKKLLGESCTDGVEYINTCPNCQHTYSYTNYYHETEEKEVISLGELGACYGEFQPYSTCLCGEVTRGGLWGSCAYEMLKPETYEQDGITHTVEIWRCGQCDMEIRYDRYEIQEGCVRTQHLTLTITVKGETVVNESVVEKKNISHNTEYQYEFAGKTCEEGVTVFWACENCGDEGAATYYEHHAFKTVIDLSQHTSCGGSIVHTFCPCGAVNEVKYNRGGCSFYTTKGEEEIDGVKHTVTTETCKWCGLVRIIDRYTEQDGCMSNDCVVYTFKMGDEVIYDSGVVISKSYENHRSETTYELLGETCLDGVRAVTVCTACKETLSEETYHYHAQHETQRVNLNDFGACYGEYVMYECVCGEESRMDVYDNCATWNSYNKYLEDGVWYYVDAYTCQTCGLRRQTVSYTEKDHSNCTETHYYSVTLTIGDQTIGDVYKYDETYTDCHEYEIKATLAEGAKSCEEGVTVTYTCRDCGYSYDDYYTWHYLIDKELVALSEYGATCGEVITLRECACGRESEIVFDGVCLFSGKDYDSEKDTAIYTCENCGFRYARQESYEAEEGSCIYYRHESYLLGCDEQGENPKYVMTRIVKGDYNTQHNTTFTDINETTEDGLTVSGSKETCSVCGYSYVEKHYYDENGNRVKRETFTTEGKGATGILVSESIAEWIYVPNADGKLQQYQTKDFYRYLHDTDRDEWYGWEREYDFGYEAEFGENAVKVCHTYTHVNANECQYREWAYTYVNGVQFELYEYTENADGYWERNEYRYDSESPCVRTQIYSNSYGEYWDNYQENHDWHYEMISEPTCTQDGVHGEICGNCGQVNGEPWINEPRGHEYEWNNNVYTCMFCGLENSYGHNGEVDVEDLTEKYGNGEYFVMGYRNKYGVAFYHIVSLVSKSGEGEEIFLDLMPEEMKDVRALRISKTELIAEATAKGYSLDDYDVKLTFVPVGADSNYDYGIVFTDSVGSDTTDQPMPETPKEDNGADDDGTELPKEDEGMTDAPDLPKEDEGMTDAPEFPKEGEENVSSDEAIKRY